MGRTEYSNFIKSEMKELRKECANLEATEIFHIARRHWHEERKGLENNYRIGDIVKYNLSEFYENEFDDNSIGGKYMKETNKVLDYATLASIVNAHPSQVYEPCVIHIRLGDVLYDKKNSTRSSLNKKPVDVTEFIEIINSVLSSNVRKVLLSASFWGNIRKTQEYLKQAQSGIPNSVIRYNCSPDEDFLLMVRAKHFVSGRGGFSEIATHIRKLNGLSTIEHPRLSGYLKDDKHYSYDPEYD
jgi:hypothetical protein